jgi:TP901 family phage tail tape measure protein
MKLTIPSYFTAVDKYSAPLAAMEKATDGLTKSMERAQATSKKFSSIASSAKNFAIGSFAVGTAIAAPLALAANEAVKFEDRMADVAKTTQLSGAKLAKLGDDILALAPKTRTSVEELQKIAAIGGQMGVAQNEILSFTESVDKFNVALGSDFAGGVDEAAKSISVLRKLFKETRELDISTAITKTGSAINAISAKGVSVPELTDFISRIGQLPDAIKPTIQATTALGAVLNKAGITSEIGARGMGDILITASQNLPAFAKQLGLTTDATGELINTRPELFLAQFAKSLQGIKGSDIGNVLKGLKIGDTGAIKVVGALGSSTQLLTEYQALLNKEFEKGTSILDEYDIKNNTTAAQIEKAKNSFEVFSIIIGRELLPALNDLLIQVAPVIKSFAAWAKENPGTISAIVKTAIAISALAFVFGGIASIVAGVSATIAGLSSAFLFLAPIIVNYLIPAVQILSAGFVGLLEIAAAFVGISFGALVGVLVAIGSIVYSIYNNWNQLVDAFKNGGIIEGLKMIGAVLLDAILLPLQKLFELLGDPYGWASGIKDLRAEMGLNVTGGETAPTVNTKATEQDAMQQYIQTNNARVQLDVNDPNGRTTARSTSDLVQIKMGSTMSFE